MNFRIFSALVAAALFLIFVGPVVIKLKDAALTVVVLIGVTMMVVDIWQSLRAGDE